MLRQVLVRFYCKNKFYHYHYHYHYYYYFQFFDEPVSSGVSPRWTVCPQQNTAAGFYTLNVNASFVLNAQATQNALKSVQFW